MCFFIMLVIVSSIPYTNSLFNNCSKSAKTLMKEGGFYTPIISECLDNHSDALIINECISIDSSTPLESSLLVRRSYKKDLTTKIVKDQFGNLASYAYNIIDKQR